LLRHGKVNPKIRECKIVQKDFSIRSFVAGVLLGIVLSGAGFAVYKLSGASGLIGNIFESNSIRKATSNTDSAIQTLRQSIGGIGDASGDAVRILENGKTGSGK
jgi:hypothetical protein